MNSSLKVLRSVLGSQVVSYHPVFARALGSVPAAVMLSQAFFWQESAKHKDSWVKEFDGVMYFTKSREEWYEATGVSRNFQQSSRDILNATGFWFEQKRGLPAKMYYHVDLDKLVEFMAKHLDSGVVLVAEIKTQSAVNQRDSDGKFWAKPGPRQVDRATVNKSTVARSTSRPSHGQQVDRGTVSIVDRGTVNKSTVRRSTIYKEETNKESLESAQESSARAQNPTAAVSANSGQTPVGQKTPPSSAAPPSLFADSSWACAPFDEWASCFEQSVSDVPGADPAWYLRRVKDWSAEKGGTSRDWISTAARFARDDQAKGKLVLITSASSQNTHVNGSHQHTHQQPRNASTVTDPATLVARTARVLDAMRKRSGG